MNYLVSFDQAKEAAETLGLSNAKGLYKTKPDPVAIGETKKILAKADLDIKSVTPEELNRLQQTDNDFAVAFKSADPHSDRDYEALSHLVRHVRNNHGLDASINDPQVAAAQDTLETYYRQETFRHAHNAAYELGLDHVPLREISGDLAKLEEEYHTPAVKVAFGDEPHSPAAVKALSKLVDHVKANHARDNSFQADPKLTKAYDLLTRHHGHVQTTVEKAQNVVGAQESRSLSRS